jgi:hypothetical protein
MILLTMNDMGECEDFIMWGNIEFAMQLELFNAYEIRKSIAPAATGSIPHAFTIIDMSHLSQLQSMASGETLYVVGHGYDDLSGITIQRGTTTNWDSYDWDDLGEMIGEHIPNQIEAIHLLACYGGQGLRTLASGLAKEGKTGITLRGYYGPAINSSAAGPTLVVDESRPVWAKVQDALVSQYIPKSQLDSWRASHSSATAAEIAMAAAEIAWDFYVHYGKTFDQYGFFYGPSKRESKIYEWTS